jgi:hypothetical protein
MRVAWLLIIALVAANYSSVVLKSCARWKLNRLPLVKEFIQNEASKFGVDVSYVGGDPRLVFIDEEGKEVKEINISDQDPVGISRILEAHGFYAHWVKKSSISEASLQIPSGKWS